MKYLRRATAILLLSSLVFAFDGNIGFNPPVAYTNGDPLLEQELDFYSWYCGGNVFVFDSIIGNRTAVVPVPVVPGDYTCWLTVTTLYGVESTASNAVNFTVGPRTPGAPTNLTITLG